MLQVRYEDLRDHFDSTVTAILDRLYSRFSPEERQVALAAARECDPGAWSSAGQQASSNGVAPKDEALSRSVQAAVMSSPLMRQHVCGLQQALDYTPAEGCRRHLDTLAHFPTG